MKSIIHRGFFLLCATLLGAVVGCMAPFAFFLIQVWFDPEAGQAGTVVPFLMLFGLAFGAVAGFVQCFKFLARRDEAEAKETFG